MSTQPFGFGKFRTLDSNGLPLAGGKLYAYAAGTTTPQATYTDYSGTVANANPVVLDASGQADVWLTQGILYKFQLTDAAGNVQWTEDNVPATPIQASSATNPASVEPGGRLTLGGVLTPVTTTDFVSQGTLYYAPYKSDQVPLYDGVSTWISTSIGAGLSNVTTDAVKNPAAVVNNSNYDLFVWSDLGTIRLSRGPAWTSDTARGTGVGTTEIQQINGRWVNKQAITNGPLAQRGLYVGTVRSDGAAQFNDSALKRFVWNMNNRMRRPVSVIDKNGGVVWNSSTSANTWRQTNTNVANVIQLVRGFDEDPVDLVALLFGGSGLGGVTLGATGIGINTTSSNSAQVWGYAKTGDGQMRSAYHGAPGPGLVQLYWLESIGTGSTGSAFQGQGGTFFGAAGMSGEAPA